jgi:hypothetical protein
VVEQQILVQVRGSDGQPAVVDNAHVGVNLHRPIPLSDLVPSARQKPSSPVVSVE